jgi:hypothetical protein
VDPHLAVTGYMRDFRIKPDMLEVETVMSNGNVEVRQKTEA